MRAAGFYSARAMVYIKTAGGVLPPWGRRLTRRPKKRLSPEPGCRAFLFDMMSASSGTSCGARGCSQRRSSVDAVKIFNPED